MKKNIFTLLIVVLLLLTVAIPSSFAQQEGEDGPDLPPEPTPSGNTAVSPQIFIPIAAFFFDPSSGHGAADPLDPATGFNRDLIPIEMQAWWQPAYGHVHTGIMLPFAKEVAGTLALPVRIVMHMNPGKLNHFAITDQNAKVLVRVDMKDQTCPMSATSMVCAWGFTVNLNTHLLPDGCQELRIKSYIDTPDGKQMINSSGAPIRVKNGDGKGKDFNKSCDTHQLIGRGWYTSFDYTNAIIGNVPIAPVHGTYVFTARAQQKSAHLFVAIDKTHYIPAVQGWPAAVDNPGIILFDKAGNFQKLMEFPVDTTKLSNGWHNFQVRSDRGEGTVSKCTMCPQEMSQPSGLAKIWFYVEN